MIAGEKDERGYTYCGNLSATPPWHSVSMECDACKLFWIGCWDNYQCPKCGEGELPKTVDFHDLALTDPVLYNQFI